MVSIITLFEIQFFEFASLHPGVSINEALENSQFEIMLPKKIKTSHEPTDEDLRILREEIGPAGIVLGK